MKYEKPKMETLNFEGKDVITTSDPLLNDSGAVPEGGTGGGTSSGGGSDEWT